MSRKSKPIDVFRHVDMVNGPEWTDPETGETSQCWPFTGAVNSEGRPYVTVDGKKVLAYRVVYELATGELLGDRMFRHKCDNKICCNFKHGIPGDHDQNMDDMKQRERHGMSHHMVKYIKRMMEMGKSDAEIALMTGVSVSSLRDLRSGKNYSHVTLDEEPTNGK